MWTPERAVLDANLSFYDAIAARDINAMDKLWSNSQPVACIHTGWQALHGRERVMASWRTLFKAEASPIRCETPKTMLLDPCALVTCVEHGVDSRAVATNVFVLEDGLWRMIHHQSGTFTTRQLGGELVPPRQKLN